MVGLRHGANACAPHPHAYASPDGYAYSYAYAHGNAYVHANAVLPRHARRAGGVGARFRVAFHKPELADRNK